MDGKVRCTIGDKYVDTMTPISTSVWTHIGCTYDNSILRIYVGGTVAGCYMLGSPVVFAGNDGVQVGMPFDGAVDNIHVLARAAIPQEMCGFAEGLTCASSCPPGHD
jgi:hypothetical protein